MAISILAQSKSRHNRINGIISFVTALLVFLVALGSFALSYNALQDMALRNGITGWLSFIWPLLIDFSLIVFSLAVVTAYLHSESTWKQWSLVGIYTIATVSFNVAHAPSNLQAQIVASIAPVSLFFSFELLMSQLKSSVKRHGITQGITELSQQYQDMVSQLEQVKQEVSQRTKRVSQLNEQISSLEVSLSANDTSNETFKPGDTELLNKANDTRLAQVTERREKVLSLLQEGMSQSQIADELQVSLATIKRDTSALNGKVKVVS